MSNRRNVIVFACGIALALGAMLGGSSLVAQVSNPGLQQSGAVTKGHFATWGPGTGQLQDGGAVPGSFVTSWNARTGAVLPATNDYNFNQLAGSWACSQAAALTGDVTTSAGSCAATLATVNSNVGSFGSATNCPTFTVNAKGLITAASDATCTPAVTSLTGAAALTKVDDTNVTLTLGGTPGTSLLRATSLTLGWAGNLSIARGGTGAGTQQAAFDALAPTATRAGDITYWNGTHYVNLAGNNSGTQVLTENSSGVPSWSAAGTGTVTSVTQGAGMSFSATPCTSTCTVAQIFGPQSVENCTLAESHASSNVTFALKTQAGSDPSASSPCVISFDNATIGTGDYTAVSVTAATSVTLNSGSTLGTANNVPFRVWVTAWNNAGTVALGVSVNSAANQVFPINTFALQSSTACSACATATATGTYYTTSALSSKAIRVVGFATYEAGLATAGAWTASPTSIRLAKAGTPLPGQPTGQIISIRDAAALTTTSSTPQPSGSDATITLSSAANGVRYSYTGSGQTNTTATQMQAQVYRATSSACTTAVGANLALTSGLATTQNPFSMGAQINFPRTASTVTYHYLVCALSSNNADTIILSASGTNAFVVEEIMG